MPVCPAKTSPRWLSLSSFVDAISSTSSTSLCDVAKVIVTSASSVLRHQRRHHDVIFYVTKVTVTSALSLLRHQRRHRVVIFQVTKLTVTSTSSVLRHQRHYAFADDKRPAVVHLLLHSGAEGPDRRRRPTQLPHLPAQRRRQHSQDI